MRRVITILLFLCVPSAFGARALAQAPDQEETSFWEEMATPGITEYRRLIAEARAFVDRSEHHSGLERLERAAALLPDQGEAHAWTAYVLTRMGRHQDAVTAWDLVRRDHDELLADQSLAFECTIALARTGRYGDAAELYRRMLTHGVSQNLRPVVLVNLAEMMVAASCDGVEDAIDLYHEAVRDYPDRAGAHWGLGAALARAGRDEEARVALTMAMRLDPQWTTFSRSGSFFVPPYDIHFYRALGWEQIQNTDQARSEWLIYLERGGSDGCWAEVARAHLEALNGGRRGRRAR